ncbi:hypothetical protein POM88_053693 [Heracleum sosnowskyi]|uniref:Protein FAR1-RELATED SEQUENCE n=1 Tax=Heracleum sosnowskyi TaxID=360622 RepID=A0AAD8LXK4_9APIA|nr:hypothetical protein POM88_053693 [Heracleum sosnowskyi]
MHDMPENTVGLEDMDKRSLEEQNNHYEGQYDNIDATLIPYDGTEFSSDEITYDFYRNFVVKVGFATRKYSSQKSKAGIFEKKIFVYSKEGLRKEDKRVAGREVKHRMALNTEREKTFTWLFQQWLSCMWNKTSGAIITDQGSAIRNAIKSVFPHTHHRFFKWHLGLHTDEHLRSLRCSYNPEFDDHYRKWTKNRDIEESEKAWFKMKENYKHYFLEPLTEKQKSEIKSWRWLENMHDQRKHWVRAYLQKTFFAGMKSSQRSESINAFFDRFVHSSTPLSEFIDQYDNAIADRHN